jgi:two-component system sensor histidine kinase HydH
VSPPPSTPAPRSLPLADEAPERGGGLVARVTSALSALEVGSFASDPQLARRLVWLAVLRLVVLFAALVLISQQFLPGAFSWRLLSATLTASFALTALYTLALRTRVAPSIVAHAQLVTDQVAWTALVYVTGATGSGAASLYGLTCLAGAILLGLEGALTAVVSACAAMFGLAAGLVWGVVPPPPDQPPELYPTRWSELRATLYLTLLAIVVVSLLASYLAERLRATGGRLEAATKRAAEAERLAELGRLAAGLAHEIRNPLGAIAGSIELLRTGGTLAEEDKTLCSLMSRETARLNDLVSDMLDLSRTRAPAREPVDVVDVALGVVKLANQSGRGSDVGVHYVGADTPCVVSADGAMLRQVVWNLVRNAVQASSAGDAVKVSVRREGDVVVLSIADSGAGIPPEARERIFDAFYSTRSHGAGIGLAVVKRIVDDHGFAILVDGAEGTGTVFSVRMPGVPVERSSSRSRR